MNKIVTICGSMKYKEKMMEVAKELEIIRGSLAIGSAIPKYPTSEIVMNKGIIVVVILYIPISEIAVKITGIENEIIL